MICTDLLKTPAAGHRPHPKNLHIGSAEAARHLALMFCAEAGNCVGSTPSRLSRPNREQGGILVICISSMWSSRRGKPKQLHQVEFTAKFISSVQRSSKERRQTGRKTKRKCMDKRRLRSGFQVFFVCFLWFGAPKSMEMGSRGPSGTGLAAGHQKRPQNGLDLVWI